MRLAVLFVALALPLDAAAATHYYPAPETWETRRPSEVGMDEAALGAAVAWAQTQETQRPRDLSDQVSIFGRLLGLMPRERGGVNGIVLRRGYIVAEFGDTGRVDPSYSVAKSYLSTLLGLAVDRGLVRSVKDPVQTYVTDGGYDSPHNAKVTWEHHVRQTSEWEGSMFGKAHDFVGAAEFGAGQRPPRLLREPGTFYEYNDVRINRFALSLLRIWRRPLPDVLATEIMDRVGASRTWVYHGYDNSGVEVDGKAMTSVPGGTRWGGGLWMSTRDHARFGYLMLRKGRWREAQILSEAWIREATARGPDTPDYGYLWWLNTEGRTSFSARGAGQNTIWIDPEHDLVIVWRWHRGSERELARRILASITS